MPRKIKPIKVRFGKGVLAKDGRTPYAAGTIHATGIDGFMSPYVFSYATVARLLADDSIAEIQIIDTDNVRSTITKTWLERDTSRLDAMRAEMVEMTARIVAESAARQPAPRRAKTTARRTGTPAEDQMPTH